MALDATPGDSSANSYLTVADADEFAEADMGPEAIKWLDSRVTVVQREQALKRATQEIDGYIRTGWDAYDTTQALRFPREIDTDSGGSPFIPSDIERATYHQAAYVLKNAAVIDAANARHARNLRQFSEGTLSGTPDDEATALLSPRALHFLSNFPVAGSPSRAGGMRSLRVTSGFPQ